MRATLLALAPLLAQVGAFSGRTAVRVARPAVRTGHTVHMAIGGGAPGGGGLFSRLAGRASWSSAARGGGRRSHDGGALGGGGGRDGFARGAGEGTGDAEDGSAPSGVWAGYLALLESQPVVTKGLTSFVGFGVGDILAQLCIEKRERFDWKRCLRFSSAGALIHGPTSHWFYGNLDSLIPGATARKVATKVIIVQLVYAPIFGTLFFSYMAAMEGKGPLMVAQRVKHELMTAVAGSWKVWPLAHAINFALVPTSQRILYINSIQIGYNMFLSIIGSRGA